MNARDLTIVYAPGQSDAAVYNGDDLLYAGHADDIQERLIEDLGVTVEHADFITDKAAPGWSGVARTLTEAIGGAA